MSKSSKSSNRNPKIESKIESEDFEIQVARVIINGHRFGYSVGKMNEDDKEWLCRILVRQFEDVFKLGYDRAIEDVKEARKEYLDLVS